MDEIEAEQIINSAVHFLVEAGWDSYPSDHPLRSAIVTLLSQAREEGRREGGVQGFRAAREPLKWEPCFGNPGVIGVGLKYLTEDEWIESLKEKK